MNQIGILSLGINTDDLNHGAVLHTWAFQQYLTKKFGADAEVIDYVTPRLQDQNMKYPAAGLLKQKKYKSAAAALTGMMAHKRRYEKFLRFKNANIRISRKRYYQEELAHATLKYDTIISESDVIWDPHFFGGQFDPAFFLALSSMKEKRRIAYSPSAGNLEFSPVEAMKFQELLSHVEHISARETYEADYINTVCKREAECVVDPVLLLRAEDYAHITAKRMIREPYLLLYTPVGYDLNLIRQTDTFARSHGLKVVEISRYPFDNMFHKTIADPGIEEFLSLVKYSDVVVCNSFHGICFSILFKRDFYAYARATGKKTEDLCKRFGVPERYFNGELHDVSPINYELLYKKLEEQRSRSHAFLYKALK